MAENENRGIVDRLNQYGLEANTMYLASISLTENLNLDHVLDVLLTLLKKLIPYDSANVMLLESDSVLRVSALRGYHERGENLEQIRQISFNVSESPILQKVLKGSVIIDDTNNHPDWVSTPGVEFVRNWIGVPLIVAGKLVGIYSLDKAVPNFFSAEHIDLAEMLAPQAATAIQNAQLYSNLQQQAGELEARVKERTERLNQQYQRQVLLADLKIALTQANQLKDVLQEVVQATVRLLPTHDASIILWDEENKSFFTSCSTVPTQDPHTVAKRIRNQGGASSWITKNQQPLVVSDIRNDTFGANKILTEYKYQAYVGVPLLVQGESIGVLYGLCREIRDYQETDVDFMKALANQASTAIQSASLLEQIHEHISLLKTRVAERTMELSLANEKLTELDHLKTKFMHDVSHELRTPLSNLNLYIDLLERGDVNKRQQYLNILKQSTEKMGHLVEDILQLSHIEIDGQDLILEFVPINEIFDPVIAKYLPQADAKHLKMNNMLELNLPPIWGNRTQLNDAIAILVENAISFTNKGQINLNSFFDAKKGQIAIQVTDTGIGVSAEEKRHLFEPFYRSQRVSQSTLSGMGVGLTILKKIIDLHHGEIEIESQVGLGSSFTVWLPIHSDTKVPKQTT